MSAGLFSDVIDNYIFEKLDKQILGKLPYCLFLALGFSILMQIFEKIQNFSSVAINFGEFRKTAIVLYLSTEYGKYGKSP